MLTFASSYFLAEFVWTIATDNQNVEYCSRGDDLEDGRGPATLLYGQACKAMAHTGYIRKSLTEKLFQILQYLEPTPYICESLMEFTYKPQRFFPVLKTFPQLKLLLKFK